jgi:hypothetical protein
MLKRRRRWATVSVVFTLTLVCFSYYFYQVFFTANIETKGKPTYVIVHRGDDWKKALNTIDATGVVVDKLSLHFVAKLMKYPEHVKPGRYELKDGYTNRQLINVLKAGLQSPLKLTFTDRTTTIVIHERGKYVCPLVFPQASPDACPVNHQNWSKGGCTAMMPTCAGARIRYQLDRDSDEYKAIFKQRTADERSNAQAVDLGIERPRLRRGSAIANQNTLIYVLINLRALQRIQAQQAELARQALAVPKEVTALPGT